MIHHGGEQGDPQGDPPAGCSSPYQLFPPVEPTCKYIATPFGPLGSCWGPSPPTAGTKFLPKCRRGRRREGSLWSGEIRRQRAGGGEGGRGGRQTRHHGDNTQYLLLIFIPGKETEGGPLFPSAKLVVLGRPLIVGKVQIRRKLSKIPFHFTRTRESRAQLCQAGPCFLLYYLPCHLTKVFIIIHTL